MKGELIQMEFIPYKANECFEHLYYQIPMELFFNKKSILFFGFFISLE